jgi:hypothetical protein
MRGWQLRLDASATAGAVSLIQDPMDGVHVDGRKFKDLVCIVRREVRKGPGATPTLGRPQMLGGGRAQLGLVYARVAEFGTGPTRSRPIALFSPFAKGRIR